MSNFNFDAINNATRGLTAGMKLAIAQGLLTQAITTLEKQVKYEREEADRVGKIATKRAEEIEKLHAKLAEYQTMKSVGKIVRDVSGSRPIYEDGSYVFPNRIPSKAMLNMEFRGALSIGTRLFAHPTKEQA